MLKAWTKLRNALHAFRRAHGGNTAITFAFAIIPVVGFIGAGYDYSNANSVKADMQAALDSTALMLSKDAATLSNDDLQVKARTYFTALFNRPNATIDSVGATYVTSGGSIVTVTGQVNVPTTFLRMLDLMGMNALQNVTINGSSTTTWGTTRLRVALVLDNTGSMADDGKMDALKTATKNLLTQLQDAATANGDVYVSIIPFAKDVNVGASNYTANWIKWTSWDSNNQTCNWNSGSGWTCTVNSHSTWNGCVKDRGTSTAPGTSADYDQKVDAPDSNITASLFVAEQYSSCPVAMKGLNYDWTSMNSLVDSMQPSGGTNQPIGLVWGWQSLVGGGPLSAPALDPNYTYQQVIILLSDGLNTQDRWYGNGSQVSTDVDHRMVDTQGNGTCANIRAAGINIYTIQVNTGGDATSTLLDDCASKDKSGKPQFFMLTKADDIITTFNTIGTNLTKLRVAR